MDKNFKFTQLIASQFYPVTSFFCIFIFFLLERIGIAFGGLDPRYQACVPTTCGDGQSISFPFYIENQQEPFCGYPGFQLSCNEKGNPVLNLSSNVYVINQIFYDNQSLRVSDAAVSETNRDIVCNFPRLRNVSLPKDRLFLAPNETAELVLLYNCNSSLPENFLQYKTGNCSSEDQIGTVLALFEDNSDLAFASKECSEKVEVPVDKYEADREIGIGEMVRRGFLLQWIASDCRVCEESGGKCGFDELTYHVQCYCSDRPHARSCTRGSGKVGTIKIAAAAAATAIGIGILIILAFCYRKKFSLCNKMIFWKKTTENYQNIEDFLRNYGSLAPKRYSYAEIKKMTSSFKHKLGQGGYGGVYRGKLHDGRNVAVKVLNESKGNGQDFINEVASVSRTSHVNIVTLLGFCFEGHRRALIYEFVPNGSLEKFIYGKNPLEADNKLTWQTLYEIAVGIARGLEYLHRGCSTRIFHFDIKPHNILLDEDFCPKISDFGLAKICPRKESVVSMTGARGTVGYIAPEVFCRNFGDVSHKSDVYSYGMMVFEMTGRRNNNVGVNRSSDVYFPDWIYNSLETDEELVLQGIENDEDKEHARKMIIVSLWCIQTNPSDRPAMNKVVEMLEGTLDSLQIPPKPFLSSRGSQPGSSNIPVSETYS